MKTVFLRVLEAENKAQALLEAIGPANAAETAGRTGQGAAALGSAAAEVLRRFEIQPAEFRQIQSAPFAYWVSSKTRQLFTALEPFEHDTRTAKQGLVTGDDFRLIRLWAEASAGNIGSRWRPYAKGGALSSFYSDVGTLVGYDRGQQVVLQTVGRFGRGATHYYRPGLTWPLRASRFAPQAMPAGCIFSARGYSAFAPPGQMLWLLALLNSRVFDYLFKLSLGRFGFPEFIVGVLQRVPVPAPSEGVGTALAALARSAWRSRWRVDTSNEQSHAFSVPALLQIGGDCLASRVGAWVQQLGATMAGLAESQAEIDSLCFDLYGIDEADRKSITEGFAAAASTDATDTDEADSDAEGGDEEAEDGDSVTDLAVLAAELVSWAVGVAFGRFDVRLATGERPMPLEPEPFDPLPACSPGMLTGGDGLPLARPPAGYPIDFAESGVLVDDPGHPRDLTAAARRVFDVVLGAEADRWWSDVAAAIDPKRADVRCWLDGSFFEFHIRRYSKSRRKAPIYWQLGTPSASYSVWLYAHRVSRDTFFQLQNDIVGPKLLHEEQRLAGLIERAGATPSAAVRKEIAAQESFVEELRAMLDEVKRVAPLWNLDLDDGIVLVMAPLWRLVPQHKAWQKELKSKWDELVAGKYDWAHLAMHLWPERVVPKCATDRSLAIAHGLEDEFWLEGTDGKWKARTTPTRPVEELVRERSSPAVKAALKSLLEASAPGGSSRQAGSGRRGARP